MYLLYDVSFIYFLFFYIKIRENREPLLKLHDSLNKFCQSIRTAVKFQMHPEFVIKRKFRLS